VGIRPEIRYIWGTINGKQVKKILIIDDSNTNVVLLEAILLNKGYEIQTAQNVREAYSMMDKEEPSLILLGLRSTGKDASISPVSRFAVIRHSLMNSIIGIGLYQGMEFILQKNASSLAAHSGIVFSRIYNNLRLVLRSRIYSYEMGRDISRNHEVLSRFITTGNTV